MLKVLFEHKAYIVSNARSELKYRYAGSFIGVFWYILNPLLQIMIYTFVFSTIMKAKLNTLDTTGSFSVYLCAGMFGWLSFQECINRGTNTFIENSAFLKKLPIPEIVFLAQRALSSLLSCITNYSLIFIYALIIMKKTSEKWLLVPVILLLFITLGFGISMLLATLNVLFRDIAQFLGVAMMIWMWLTPIVYIKEILPDKFLWVLNINIAYPYINALQQIIVFDALPHLGDFVKMSFISIASVLFGYMFLQRYSKELRDLI